MLSSVLLAQISRDLLSWYFLAVEVLLVFGYLFALYLHLDVYFSVLLVCTDSSLLLEFSGSLQGTLHVLKLTQSIAAFPFYFVINKEVHSERILHKKQFYL